MGSAGARSDAGLPSSLAESRLSPFDAHLCSEYEEGSRTEVGSLGWSGEGEWLTALVTSDDRVGHRLARDTDDESTRAGCLA